eukprot:13281064-Alexandrium_andersonii.AAC.1
MCIRDSKRGQENRQEDKQKDRQEDKQTDRQEDKQTGKTSTHWKERCCQYDGGATALSKGSLVGKNTLVSRTLGRRHYQTHDGKGGLGHH